MHYVCSSPKNAFSTSKPHSSSFSLPSSLSSSISFRPPSLNTDPSVGMVDQNMKKREDKYKEKREEGEKENWTEGGCVAHSKKALLTYRKQRKVLSIRILFLCLFSLSLSFPPSLPSSFTLVLRGHSGWRLKVQ